MIVSDRRSHILCVIVKWLPITDLCPKPPDFTFEIQIKIFESVLLIIYPKKFSKNFKYGGSWNTVEICPKNFAHNLFLKKNYYRKLVCYNIEMIGEMITDHDCDRRSQEFHKVIVSDRRSWKMWSALALPAGTPTNWDSNQLIQFVENSLFWT